MKQARFRTPRIVTGLVAVLLTATAAAGIAPARIAEIAAQFREAQYQGARQSMAGLVPSDAEPGLVRLWQQRLSFDPAVAEDLAQQIVRDRSISPELRLQSGLDAASVALARQRPDVAWELLQPLLEFQPASLPGEVYLLAGQAMRLAGDQRRAREMLASVRPDDPAFAPARTLLGRIGLDSGDHELALRYFESAARRLEPAQYLDLEAGTWQALRMLGRDIEARDLADSLVREHPASLAALELRESLRREEQETAESIDTADSTASAPVDDPRDAGRFTIQLAAFHDRALALRFVDRWRAEVAGLRIVRGQDDHGQSLHRIQVGSFMSRVQAMTELNRMQRHHGLEGFVAESTE